MKPLSPGWFEILTGALSGSMPTSKTKETKKFKLVREQRLTHQDPHSIQYERSWWTTEKQKTNWLHEEEPSVPLFIMLSNREDHLQITDKIVPAGLRWRRPESSKWLTNWSHNPFTEFRRYHRKTNNGPDRARCQLRNCDITPAQYSHTMAGIRNQRWHSLMKDSYIIKYPEGTSHGLSVTVGKSKITSMEISSDSLGSWIDPVVLMVAPRRN